jgi:hypothetical protein
MQTKDFQPLFSGDALAPSQAEPQDRYLKAAAVK